jgi:hypothetical protein
MHWKNNLHRLTDKNSDEFFNDPGKPFVLLFESPYEPNAGKMAEALASELTQFGSAVAGAVCVFEETPDLFRRFNIRGVPTLVAGQGDFVLGESLGFRTPGELASLLEKWLSVQAGVGEEEQTGRAR